MEDVADDHFTAPDEISDDRSFFERENSEALFDLITRRADLRKIFELETGTSQSLGEIECRFETAAGFRDVVI